ncbi:hypothetical protein ARMGADRAFT_1032424 [Armillaria gallica]|uniref:Heterokaryon incompatibility domain-containing protein n=1 Tax=Armillaria gallica TaxID=47427 RepID=A0A2H3DG08_ARMGA|nr:hypothetical protein ARMGADRAFT_1032424 [Armillaria gallica]
MDYEARVRRRDEAYAKLPEVMMSARTEIDQVEEEIIVPSQRAYTGRKPVIPASLVNTPCTTLSIRGLWDRLNTTLGTSYTLDTPNLSSLLEDCIANNYDFGIAYGRLRGAWYADDWSTIQDGLRKCEAEDQRKRREALDGNTIVDPYIYPRRVWDIYSNRVVPGHEWPVPIPKGANLDLIRIEMLNLGLEYVWLDVLCLRQRGRLREGLRVEEWRLDVPTIGYVYHIPHVVHCYLSGLGLPLSMNEGNLDNERCWFKRAWTLQEVGTERKICGDTPDGPLHAKRDKDGNYETEALKRFHEQLQSLNGIMREYEEFIFRALTDMQHRMSTNPVDKVAGMSILLGPMTLPAYNETKSLEDAWSDLVDATNEYIRGALFFKYPEPGMAGTKWRPSWDQLMTKPLPADGRFTPLIYRDTKVADQCEAPCIEKGFVRGLARGGVIDKDHRGKLIVEDAGGTIHAFNIITTHQYPIPKDTRAKAVRGEVEKRSVFKLVNDYEGLDHQVFLQLHASMQVMIYLMKMADKSEDER